MDVLKEVLSVLGALLGFLAALIPLCAFFLDRRNRVAKRGANLFDDSAPDLREAVTCSSCGTRMQLPQELLGKRIKCPACDQAVVVGPARAPVAVAVARVVEPEPGIPYLLPLDARDFERARGLVRGPAIALLVAGFLGLGFNLFMALFGFVDEFVTPLSTTTQERQAAAAAAVAGRPGAGQVNVMRPAQDDPARDPASAALAILMLLTFALASGMAIWAGFNMIRLRGYWLSMAGCFAVMPGACFCCAAGLPIGIWSLVVLLRPDVRSTFS